MNSNGFVNQPAAGRHKIFRADDQSIDYSFSEDDAGLVPIDITDLVFTLKLHDRTRVVATLSEAAGNIEKTGVDGLTVKLPASLLAGLLDPSYKWELYSVNPFGIHETWEVSTLEING